MLRAIRWTLAFLALVCIVGLVVYTQLHHSPGFVEEKRGEFNPDQFMANQANSLYWYVQSWDATRQLVVLQHIGNVYTAKCRVHHYNTKDRDMYSCDAIGGYVGHMLQESNAKAGVWIEPRLDIGQIAFLKNWGISRLTANYDIQSIRKGVQR